MAVTNAGLLHLTHMNVALKLRRHMSLGIFEYRNKNNLGYFSVTTFVCSYRSAMAGKMCKPVVMQPTVLQVT